MEGDQSGFGSGRVRGREEIAATMSKSPRVTFKLERIAEGDWQIVASCPGTETQYIGGFKSKAEVDEWLAGPAALPG